MGSNQAKRIRFAELYAKYGNATRAAKEAGYSPRSAHSQGSRLLRNRKVQDNIRGHAVNRTVHAEQTYRDLIRVADASMEHMKTVLNDPMAEPDEKSRAILACGRQLETLAKAEGLLLPEVGRGEGAGSLNLQKMIQNFKHEVKGVPAPMKLLEAPAAPKNGDTNGKTWQSITDAECGKKQEDGDEGSK